MSILMFSQPGVRVRIVDMAAPPLPANRPEAPGLADELRYLAAQVREFLHRPNSDTEAKAQLNRLVRSLHDLYRNAGLGHAKGPALRLKMIDCVCRRPLCRLYRMRRSMLSLANQLDREASDDGA